MEFQCFEIQIKTEADSNESPQDNKPFTGMFVVSDEQDFTRCTRPVLNLRGTVFFCNVD